jgi:hypothetical protein
MYRLCCDSRINSVSSFIQRAVCTWRAKCSSSFGLPQMIQAIRAVASDTPIILNTSRLTTALPLSRKRMQDKPGNPGRSKAFDQDRAPREAGRRKGPTPVPGQLLPVRSRNDCFAPTPGVSSESAFESKGEYFACRAVPRPGVIRIVPYRKIDQCR